MKKVFILLAFLFTTKNYSQDPELLNKIWYLHKIVINNETTLPLITTEVSFFDFEGVDFFSEYYPYCEQGAQTSVYYTNEDTFNLTDDEGIFIIGFCSETDIIDFMNLHGSVYFIIGGFKNPFTYAIESDGDNYMLTIENGEGDIAVYGDVQLSTADFENTAFVLHPNPVTDILTLRSDEAVKEVALYDIHGRLVETIRFNNNNSVEMDVRHLQNGMYFIKIKTESGRTAVEKFIKK